MNHKQRKFNGILNSYSDISGYSVRELKEMYYSSNNKHQIFSNWAKSVKNKHNTIEV